MGHFARDLPEELPITQHLRKKSYLYTCQVSFHKCQMFPKDYLSSKGPKIQPRIPLKICPAIYVPVTLELDFDGPCVSLPVQDILGSCGIFSRIFCFQALPFYWKPSLEESCSSWGALDESRPGDLSAFPAFFWCQVFLATSAGSWNSLAHRVRKQQKQEYDVQEVWREKSCWDEISNQPP